MLADTLTNTTDISDSQESNKSTGSYSYNSIKKIATKIGKITNKNNILDIVNIIKDNGGEKYITMDEDGTFIKFNYLTPETYIKLEQYLMSLSNYMNIKYTPISTSFTPYSDYEPEMAKLNTKEKSILNHEKYTKILESNKD